MEELKKEEKKAEAKKEEKKAEERKSKHLFIKTHRSHKWIIAIIFIVMFIMGYGLYSKVITLDSLSENNFRILTVGLLFSLNIVVMLMIILMSVLYIELKDKYFQE